jgi:hypothetical protein
MKSSLVTGKWPGGSAGGRGGFGYGGGFGLVGISAQQKRGKSAA